MGVEYLCIISWIIKNIDGREILEFHELLLEKYMLITVDAAPGNIYLFKVTIKTLEKVWSISKVNNKDTRTAPWSDTP